LPPPAKALEGGLYAWYMLSVIGLLVAVSPPFNATLHAPTHSASLRRELVSVDA